METTSIVWTDLKFVAFQNDSRLKSPFNNEVISFIIVEVFVLVVTRHEEFAIFAALIVFCSSWKEVDEFSKKLKNKKV